MNIYQKYIRELIDGKKFVDIYTDIYNEELHGYIIQVSDELLMLNCFDEIGKNNGITILRLDDVTRIRWGKKSSKKIEDTLINDKNNNAELLKIDIDDFLNVIKELNKKYGYLTIYIQDIDNTICIIGEVVEVDEETIIINEYGSIDALDRNYILFALQSITRIDAGGPYEEALKKIYK